MLQELGIAGSVSAFTAVSAYASAMGAGLRHAPAIGAAAGLVLLLGILGTMLYRCL